MSVDVRDDQVRWLADRLALAVCFLSEMEADTVFGGGANVFSEAKHMVLSDLMSFDNARRRLRKSGLYDQSIGDIRERVRNLNHTGDQNG